MEVTNELFGTALLCRNNSIYKYAFQKGAMELYPTDYKQTVYVNYPLAEGFQNTEESNIWEEKKPARQITKYIETIGPPISWSSTEGK